MFTNTKIIPVFGSHEFVEVSFIKPKKCDYCKGLVIKKGCECSSCNITVHRGKCFDRAKLLLCGGSSVTVAEVPQSENSISVTVENCIPETNTSSMIEESSFPLSESDSSVGVDNDDFGQTLTYSFSNLKGITINDFKLFTFNNEYFKKSE